MRRFFFMTFLSPRLRTLALFVAIPAGLLFLSSGCKRSAPAASAAGAPQILHLGNSAEPADLDPQSITGRPEADVVRTLMEGLVTYDPQTLEPRPGQAERWDVSPDGLIYTFHLRADARWSNGESVTATDFVRSWQRMLTPSFGAEYAYNFYLVEGAEAFNRGQLTDFGQTGFKALDERTVQIALIDPTSYFLSLILHTSWNPVPIRTVEKFGGLARKGTAWTRAENYVGNGPFVLKSWKQNQKIVVGRSPTYWNREHVALDEVHLYATDNTDTEERMFRTGKLDITGALPLSKIETYRNEKSAALRVEPYLSTAYIRTNVTRPHLADPRVRRALALAIDRERLCQRVLHGTKFPAHSLTPPNTAGFTAAPGDIRYDLDAAKALLAEAGYPDGRGFPATEVLFPTSENGRIVMEAIQEMWRKGLGIDIRLLNQEWKVYLDSLNTLNFDLSWSAWVGDYVDPSTFLDLMTGTSGNNRTGWKNAAFDRLIEAARAESEPAKRHALFQEMETLLARDAPILPLYYYANVYLVNPRVRGWYPTLLDVHPLQAVSLAPE